MKRTFAFIGGRSAKFWSVETTQDGDVIYRWGRIGTKGQSKTKSYADAEATYLDVRRKIDEKLGKGYVETTCGAVNEKVDGPMDSPKRHVEPEKPGRKRRFEFGEKA